MPPKNKLKLQATGSSKMLVHIYQTVRLYAPQDRHLHILHREYIKFRAIKD